MSAAKDWLVVDYRTRFRLDDVGRIERENDPDGSPGPLAWLGLRLRGASLRLG